MMMLRLVKIGLVLLLLLHSGSTYSTGFGEGMAHLNSNSDRISKSQMFEQQIWLKVDVDNDLEILPYAFDVISKMEIGGVVFTGHNFNALAKLLQDIRLRSKSDILFAFQGDVGAPFNLLQQLPSNEIIASISDPVLLNQFVSAISIRLKGLGVQIAVTDFKDKDTYSRMKSAFIRNGIFISLPNEKLIPQIGDGGTLPFTKIFCIERNLDEKIELYLKELKKKIRSDNEAKIALKNYSYEIELINEKTMVHDFKLAELSSIHSVVKASDFKIINRKAHQFGSVLLKNENEIVPVFNLGEQKIAYISFSDKKENKYFGDVLSKYTKVDRYQYLLSLNDSILNKIFEDLKQYNLLIFGVFKDENNCDITQKKLIENIGKEQNVINCFFGTKDVSQAIQSNAILYSYDSDSLTQSYAAQIIFGGISSGAKLSYSLKKYPRGSGLTTKGGTRFEYTIPEVAGVDGDYLSFKIDSLANMAIDAQAFPGCQVLVAKDRKIIYHQSFGYHTYYKDQKVKNDDIYDLASVTKITGTLPALMQFVDQKKIDIDQKFSDCWTDFRGTNKEDLYCREILAHQSGLQSWIPFWKNTVDSLGNYLPNIYSTVATDTFSVQILKHLFLNKNYHKVMFHDINESPVSSVKKYVYSGLPFYIFPKLIEKITKQEYPEYIQQSFYHPLGAYNITFNAGQVFPLEKIIPTEYDSNFRLSLLQGTVDDEGAAMMGGISGNAGLFSDANDLAKLLQMYLQMGEFGGRRYISDTTMREFSRCQFPENENRRGLGFDKPQLGNDTLSIENCYPAYSSSQSSFGHSGYTGTFVWCDPESQLVYIFLSNRVYPSRKNSKIYETNVRIRIHQAIYDAIDIYKNKNIEQ